MKKSLFLSIFAYFSLAGMQAPKSPVKAILSSKNGQFSSDLVKTLKATSGTAHIYAESPFFSNKQILTALKTCAQEGCTVELLLGRGSQKLQHELSKSRIAVSVNTNIHTKRFVIDDGATKVVYTGSDNASQTSQFNHELMFKSSEPEIVRRHIDYFKKDKKSDYKEGLYIPESTPTSKNSSDAIAITPEKSIVRATPDKAFIFKLNRLKKLKDVHGKLYISSMTCNHPEFVKELEDLEIDQTPSKVTLILDRACLKNKDILDRMHAAGVRIYIFNEDKHKLIFGKFPAIQHSKIILRKIDEDYLSIISTGNLTVESTRECNSDTYDRDKKVFEQLKAQFKAIKSECRLYNPDEEKE